MKSKTSCALALIVSSSLLSLSLVPTALAQRTKRPKVTSSPGDLTAVPPPQPTLFPVPTPSPTATGYPSSTPTVSATPKRTPTPTPTPTATPKPTSTPKPTATPRSTPTSTPRGSATPTPPPGSDNLCCGTKPPLKEIQNYATTYGTFTGQVVVTTHQATFGQPAVEIWDLTNQNLPGVPLGTVWNSSSNPQTNRYSHSTWTSAFVGNVFGLTLDNAGNIYVAATRIYSTPGKGDSTLPGPAGFGDIYKLDANTGAVTRFVETDAAASTYVSGNKIPNKDPGLGNIHYSCAYNNFYVTNFEDGNIYCIDSAGHIIDLWNHGANLSTPITDDDVITTNPSAPWTQLGRRTWAVTVFNGRCYYSVWNQDQARHAAGNPPNEIWSVALGGQGKFIGGTARLEITLPESTPGSGYSNPVSDISFNAAGDMLLAQRSMAGDASTSAHQANLLEYVASGSTWVLNPGKYKIGELLPLANAAGGCDFDWGVNGRAWATGDALRFDGTTPFYIYGLQGTPTSGGAIANSILIDYDNTTNGQDKTAQGDVEVPCPPPGPTPAQEPCSAIAKEIGCNKDGSGYSLDLVVTNNTGQPVIDVLLASPPGSNYTVAPAHAGPVANHASINLPVTITGGKPGDKVCFTVTFMGEDGCLCTIEVCTLPLPDCCAILNSDATKIVCNKDGTYTYATTITNNSNTPKPFIYLYPPPGVTMTPDHFIMTQPGGLPPGGVFQTPAITIKGAKPGEFCFNLSLHNKGMEGCCTSPHHCLKLPDCKKSPANSR